MNKILFKLLSLSHGLTQSLISVFGNLIATGFSALALILISRQLGPELFGEFSVGFSLVLILNRLNDLGLNAAITRFVPREADDSKVINSIVTYTLVVKTVISVLIMAIGTTLTPFLADFLHFQQREILYVAFILSAISTWYEQLLAVLQALHLFSQSVFANAAQAITKFLFASSMYLLGRTDSLLLFTFYMGAPAVPLILYRFLVPTWLKVTSNALSAEKKNELWLMARHSAVGFVCAGLIENIDVLFVQKHLSTFETGLFSGVSRIAMLLLLVAYSLGNVLYARVAKYKSREDLDVYIKKSFAVCLASLFAFICFIPFSEQLIYYSVGPEYVSGNYILIILAGSSFLTIATIPFLALFYTFKADWYFSVSGILQLAIVLLGNSLYVPLYGLEAAAYTKLATRLFLFCFTLSSSLFIYYKTYSYEKK